MKSRTLAFLATAIFLISFGVLLFELTLTRIFSIVLWYDYAFMAISVAFFGLGIGSFLVHVRRGKLTGLSPEEKQSHLISKIIQSTILFAISLPVFVVTIAHLPSDTSYIYLYYLASSVPFFFAGVAMALIFLAMPKEINKLYFIDLAGAAAATLLLNSLMEGVGAESVLILISVAVLGPTTLTYFLLTRQPRSINASKSSIIRSSIRKKRLKTSSVVVTIGLAGLLVLNLIFPALLAIPPGLTKGLHKQLANPSVEHTYTWWNSFSRVDVTRPNYSTDNEHGKPVEAATIFIDADAVTPVLKWNGSLADIQWVRNYMDYLPYEIQGNTDSALVIGGGGGEDILVGLAAGAKNITAVELNPLVISATRKYGSSSGHIYDRDDVSLFIDDGRRFISSTDSKYDIITIKLVDSWAAQLAGAYALTENYLYTVEAFNQYFAHLNGDDGMLVMVRWNTELPRLIPLVIESLRQSGRSDQQISEQLAVIEDKPGLYFGSDPSHTLYPVLVIVKSSPFTNSQLDSARMIAEKNGAEIIILPGSYIQPPYDRLLPGAAYSQNVDSPSIAKTNENGLSAVSLMKPPTDDSPFYFAKEPVPVQMTTLLTTVLAISGILAVLLFVYMRKNRTAQRSLGSRYYLIFAMLIGLGFMFLEITFIQKFLLLLGTPIMALTVILFSILISSGAGAYLSGRIFPVKPHNAVFHSIPILVGILLIYFAFLDDILYASVPMSLIQRIALTFSLLFPVGILMGFQFPSVVRLSAIDAKNSEDTDTTLLWGVTVISSITGTVFAATLAMVIGFNGNILIGLGFYLGALLTIALALVSSTRQHKIAAK
jgi:predicted membrane-bound spermidine synthase